MPELPEVETVRRTLLNQIKGLIIEDIDVRYDSIIEGDTIEFINLIKGKKIENIERLGKYLVFILSEGSFISHLRMEGKYFYVLKDSLDNKHIHVIFYLSNGYMLCYQDVRKFGRMIYKNQKDIYSTKPLIDVGIDPILTKEIEIKTIYDKIVRKTLPIKTVLLDQSILCGLGNIYVDEVLYKANISPTRLAKTMTFEEVKKIVDESIKILSKAIELKGTTIRSYTSSLGVNGEYQNFLLVHTKTHCPNCMKELTKIKIGGRSTYYCKDCQR